MLKPLAIVVQFAGVAAVEGASSTQTFVLAPLSVMMPRSSLWMPPRSTASWPLTNTHTSSSPRNSNFSPPLVLEPVVGLAGEVVVVNQGGIGGWIIDVAEPLAIQRKEGGAVVLVGSCADKGKGQRVLNGDAGNQRNSLHPPRRCRWHWDRRCTTAQSRSRYPR
jgi:hypothetical protein